VDEDEEEEEEESEESEEVPSHCTKCGSEQHPGKLLLCDGDKCGSAYHIYCLTPKLEKIPRGKW
jgi:histone demethylase JARID1